MDPQQRLLLEATREALTSTPGTRLSLDACGVFVGVSARDYHTLGLKLAAVSSGWLWMPAELCLNPWLRCRPFSHAVAPHLPFPPSPKPAPLPVSTRPLRTFTPCPVLPPSPAAGNGQPLQRHRHHTLGRVRAPVLHLCHAWAGHQRGHRLLVFPGGHARRREQPGAAPGRSCGGGGREPHPGAGDARHVPQGGHVEPGGALQGAGRGCGWVCEGG